MRLQQNSVTDVSVVSVRHVRAHPDGMQHGVSTKLYKFGKNISSDISYKNYSFDPNLGEDLCIFTSFHFPDSGLYLSNGFDFYFDLFLDGVTLKTSN